MNKSDILRQARGILDRKTADSISTALNGVVRLTPGACHQVAELRSWIQSLMDGCGTYERYLWKFHPTFAQEHDVPVFNVSLIERGWDICRPGRLQWMDWMISYWQAEETRNEPPKAHTHPTLTKPLPF